MTRSVITAWESIWREVGAVRVKITGPFAQIASAGSIAATGYRDLAPWRRGRWCWKPRIFRVKGCSAPYRGLHEYLSAGRRSLCKRLPSAWAGRGRRILVGPVRGRWRFPDDAAPDPDRHSASSGGGDRGEPDRRLIVLGRTGPLAAQDGRLQDGGGAAGRWPGWVGDRGAYLRGFAQVGPGRSDGLALLRRFPGHRRRADVRRERAGHCAAQSVAAPGRNAITTGYTACPSKCGSGLRTSVSAQSRRFWLARWSAFWRRSSGSAAASSWCRR